LSLPTDIAFSFLVAKAVFRRHRPRFRFFSCSRWPMMPLGLVVLVLVNAGVPFAAYGHGTSAVLVAILVGKPLGAADLRGSGSAQGRTIC
jgi:hypothetical protein